MLPESTLMDMSLTNYNSFLQENKVIPASASNTQMVQRVGGKIADAVNRYMRANGHSKRIKNFNC